MSTVRDEQKILGAEVAEVLSDLRGEDWHLEPDDPGWVTRGVFLAGPGQARLHLTGPYPGDGKVGVAGAYPDDCFGPYRQIGVTASRGAAVIAREISRRLLDAGYAADLAQAIEHRDAVARREAEKAARMAEVATLVGTEQDEDHTVRLAAFAHGGGQVTEYWPGDGEALSITVSGVPRQTAVDMLKVLAAAAASTARCCYAYGPGHDQRLSEAGCPRQAPSGQAGCAESEALYELYRKGTYRASSRGWADWLGPAAARIHPAWKDA